MARLLSEDFDSYTDGQLNGQGGWGSDTHFSIQAVEKYQGAKAVKITATGYYDIQKSVAAVVEGEISIMMKRKVSAGSASTYQTIFTKDADARLVAEIGFIGPDIKYNSDNTWITMMSGYDLDRWYKLTMQWTGAPSYKCRYKIDSGEWTAWVTRGLNSSTKPPILVLLEGWQMSGGAEAYYDYIT